MKFNKLSQLFLVSSIGLLVSSLLISCAITTIDYVFVASSSGSGTSTEGQIQTFAVDSESGALRTGLPPADSGGINPVAMVTTSDYANLYVANKTSGTVTHFTIAYSGKLTAQSDQISIPAPVALAVNTAGTYLYVVSGTTSATLSEYALSSGTISAPASPVVSVPLAISSDVIVPAGITVLANTSTVSGNGIYVAVADQSSNLGYVFGFTVGSSGALTATASSPYQAGVQPSGIASDPTDRFVYVTDFANNDMIGYTILDGSTLSFMTGGPFATGNQPSAIVVDPRGEYIYVTNSLDSTVSNYAITLANGIPTAVVNTNSANIATDSDPVALAIDPALGRFIYTANHLGNSVSGFLLNPNSGAISPTQATPYPAGYRPSAVAVIPHGNHATESVTP
ncbi:MAG: lactonase family protein [Terracidiphilus sp.]